MTIEDMQAECDRMKAHLKWLREDAIAELTERLATEKNPYSREFLIKQLEEVRALA